MQESETINLGYGIPVVLSEVIGLTAGEIGKEARIQHR